MDLHEPFIIDGGLGTSLPQDLTRGHFLWSAVLIRIDPEAILKIHEDFFKSGANVAITSCYQASIEGFCSHFGIDIGEAEGLFDSAIQIAERARQNAKSCGCSQPMYIMQSSGSIGATLGGPHEYIGTFQKTDEEIQHLHRQRIQSWERNSHICDGIVFETIPQKKEALAIVSLIREYPQLKRRVWISLSCGTGDTLRSGESFRDTIADLIKADNANCIAGIGVNCSSVVLVNDLLCMPNLIDDLVHRIPSKKTEIEQLVLFCYCNNEPNRQSKQPNKPSNEPGITDQKNGDNYILEYVDSWIKGGVRGIGGCCGTTDKHILQLSQAVKTALKEDGKS